MENETNKTTLDLTQKRQAIVVLGMHRSGTSALTGSLDILGCTTPITQIKQSAQNPKGFFEATPIARLNDALLDSVGQTWNSWHPLPTGWVDQPEVAALIPTAKNLLIQEFGTPNILALKDPRICRLLPFWMKVFEQQNIQLLIAHIHRNPVEVAQSLRTRNGFELSQGLLLWLTYVLSAERASRGMQRSFISFPQLLKDPVDQMTRLVTDLNAHVPNSTNLLAPKTSDFISPELRHHSTQTQPQIPALHQRTFDILERWAVQGEMSGHQEQDYAQLDQIWRLFSIFGAASTQPDLNTDESNLTYMAAFQITPDPNAPLPSLPKASGVRVAHIMNALTSSLNQELEYTATHLAQEKDNTIAALARLNDSLQSEQSLNAMLEVQKGKNTQQSLETKALQADMAHLQTLQTNSAIDAKAMQDELQSLKKLNDTLQRSRDDLRLDLSDKGETIKRLSNASSALSREIEHLNAENKMLEDRIKDTQKGKVAAQNTWASTERARRALERKASSLTKERAELNQLASYIDAERQAMLGSTSWRLTRPIRWISKHLRRRPSDH